MGRLSAVAHVPRPTRIAGRSTHLLALAACALAAAATACGPRSESIPDPRLEALSTQVASQGTLLAHLATQVGAIAHPTTPMPGSVTPYLPLTGAVLLEDGRCCVGGLAGSTVYIRAAFTADSPFAEVTEMRVQAGSSPAGLEVLGNVGWEPFQQSKTYSAVAAINWLGFYVSVQYRDAQGHLSPVFVDDISIEGSVPPPT